MAETGPIARQPTKLDYASPTQFKFGIHQLPLVEYFVTAVDLPDVSLGTTVQNTPFKDIPIPGEKLTYAPLTVTFLVDEYLENYVSLHNWMTGIGFPTKREQFKTFRDVTSNTQTDTIPTPPIDKVGNATPERTIYSDAYLMILSNKNNPILNVNFENVFPTSLSGLDYTQGATDVEYMTVQADFTYQIYEIVSL